METQGHPIHANVLYQGNKTPMKIELNGKLSYEQKLWHIDV